MSTDLQEYSISFIWKLQWKWQCSSNVLNFPCREAACSESEDDSNETLSGPSMQSQSSAKGPAEDTDDDDEGEFIGPPLPPGFKDSDDDNDDDTEEEDNVSSLFLFKVLIPWVGSDLHVCNSFLKEFPGDVWIVQNSAFLVFLPFFCFSNDNSSNANNYFNLKISGFKTKICM